MDGQAINNPITEENIMGMQINTNVAALNAYRNLSNTQNDLSKSLEKLSSGLRINRAADDAAGLAISEGLRSQIGGLTVAARNAQDGISVIQTAEGSLTEVHSILQRMRDLAVQAGNDSNSDEARKAIATEVKDLSAELGRISESTNFNGIQLLDGTAGSLKFQVGADGEASSQIGVNLDGANISAVANALGVGTSGTTYGIDLATVTGAMAFEITDEGGTTSVVTTTLAGGPGDYSSVAEIAAELNGDAGFSGKLIASTVETGPDSGVFNLVVTAKSGGVVTADDAGTATGVTAG